MPTKSRTKSRSKVRSKKTSTAPSRRPIRKHDAAASNSRSSLHDTKPEISENMSLVELQKIARSKGIPFGGLRKSQLIRKILTY